MTDKSIISRLELIKIDTLSITNARGSRSCKYKAKCVAVELQELIEDIKQDNKEA